MIESDRQIGQIVRKLRKEREMTMKQLAAAIGVSEQAISQYELGKRKLSSEQIKVIASTFKVPPGILFSDLNDVVRIEAKPPTERTQEEQSIFDYFTAQITSSENTSITSEISTAFDDVTSNIVDVLKDFAEEEKRIILDLVKSMKRNKGSGDDEK